MTKNASSTDAGARVDAPSKRPWPTLDKAKADLTFNELYALATETIDDLLTDVERRSARSETKPHHLATTAATEIEAPADAASACVVVPLNEQDIEFYRAGTIDGQKWRDRICDMAINSLLYAEEIHRLRSQPSYSLWFRGPICAD